MTAISSSEETGFFRDIAENNYKTLKKTYPIASCRFSFPTYMVLHKSNV